MLSELLVVTRICPRGTAACWKSAYAVLANGAPRSAVSKSQFRSATALIIGPQPMIPAAAISAAIMNAQ